MHLLGTSRDKATGLHFPIQVVGTFSQPALRRQPE